MHETQSSHGEVATGHPFRLGNLHVDPATGLIEGPESTEQVDPKVMAVFETLAVHPGELVTREDLLGTVWPERIVTDSVLSRCIYQLRLHLVAAGGDEALHDVVETLPRRGYRLNGEVLPDDQDRSAGPRRWRLAALASVLMLVAAWWAWQHPGGESGHQSQAAAPPVVAVLPFVDLSPGSDREYFADGVSEELINTLTRVPSLRVIARTSAFQFKGQTPDIATVAGQLNATHVLEGAVRHTGNRVRISAQLVDAGNGHPLWSDTFEGELENVFAIQDEVAAAVGRALELNLAPADLAGEAPASSAASTHYLQGQFMFNRRSPGDLGRAAAQYRSALEIDPDFARAWAGLAGVYMIQTFNADVPEADGLTLTHDAAQHALDLDPTLPEAHFRMACHYDMQGKREAAAPYWEAARRYGENNPLILGVLAGRASWDGRREEAIELGRQAIALDPLSAMSHDNHAVYLLAAGRLDESRKAALAALALRPENDPGTKRISTSTLVAIDLLEGRAEEALPLLEDWPAEDPRRDLYAALIYEALGRQAEAEAAITRMLNADDVLAAVRLAQVFAHRGDHDAAFAWLNTALERLGPEASRVQRGVLFSQFHASPFLQPLYDNARWQEWLDRFWAGLR